MDSLNSLAYKNNLKIVYENKMPNGEGGLIYGNKILLNPKLSYCKKKRGFS